jgi:hypothetical protein
MTGVAILQLEVFLVIFFPFLPIRVSILSILILSTSGQGDMYNTGFWSNVGPLAAVLRRGNNATRVSLFHPFAHSVDAPLASLKVADGWTNTFVYAMPASTGPTVRVKVPISFDFMSNPQICPPIPTVATT